MTFDLNDRVVSLIDTHGIDRGDPGVVTFIRHRRAPLATEYTVDFGGHVRRMTGNQLGVVPDNVAYPDPCQPIRVRFNLNGAELAIILANTRLSPQVERGDLTRDEALDIVVRVLRADGLAAACDWNEINTPSETFSPTMWAARQVRRLWPRLDDQPLAYLLADYGPAARQEELR